MALIRALTGSSGGGAVDLVLADHADHDGNDILTKTVTVRKAGYLYIFTTSSSYKSGTAGGTCTITITRDGTTTTVPSSEYLYDEDSLNINSAHLAKIMCKVGDVVNITARGLARQVSGGGYFGNAILIVGADGSVT